MTPMPDGPDAPDAPAPPAPPAAGVDPARRPLPRNVRALAAVSLLTDVSSEMIYPLLPVFLATTLGAGARFVGVVEGAAESTAALLKLASGWWSDRVQRRKPLVVAGYALASAARPLVALAQTAGHVLAIRVLDRVGKGIRTSPRDALIADSVGAADRGRAFGFHRAADHLGAVIGPLVAFALLQWGRADVRTVFWLAGVPAAAAVVLLVVGVKEGETRRRVSSAGGAAARIPQGQPLAVAGEERHPHVAARGEIVQGGAPRGYDGIESREDHHPGDAPSGDIARRGPPQGQDATAPSPGGHIPRRFWLFVAAILLFTLGNSTDAFLLLRASELGVGTALVPVLWAMLHVVKSAASTPAGALSDRVGRRPLIIAGWVLYSLVYVAFGHATSAWHAWGLFAVYGVFFGLTEGVEKALVADLVPPSRRGVAFGWYNLAMGLAALPASVLFGVLWDRYGAATAFTFGAAMALVAAGVIAIAVPRRTA